MSTIIRYMNKRKLENLYLVKKFSSKEISEKFFCSQTKVNYWLSVYKIKKRTISEAIYQKRNPDGNPFLFIKPKSLQEMFLFGLGLGLFWGEGSKRSKHSVRLSNSDPQLVKKFIDFLINIYHIDKNKLRFQLQIHYDLDMNQLLDFWSNYLLIKKTQFFKTTILKNRGDGTYTTKIRYGVIIVNFGNSRLKNLISSQIANIENM